MIGSPLTENDPDSPVEPTPVGPESSSSTPSGSGAPTSDKPKRRGQVNKRHTVAKVILATAIVLAMVAGLGTIYLYRHFKGNMNVVDPWSHIVIKEPAKKVILNANTQPMNILVMGTDTRECAGCNVDKHTGDNHSDTTILLHVGRDGKFAYGISVPRDSMVNRPDCQSSDGGSIPAATYQMWNEAFQLGGPACTIAQFESLTGVKVDDFVAVNFAGFKDMVDAIGGVEVCLPQPIKDPLAQLDLPAGVQTIKGQEALGYVRERHAVGDGSDLGRIKRQQAFIASMINKVMSGPVLTNPVKLVSFLNAATNSLTVDPGLDSPLKMANIAWGLRNIGLGHIKFVTVPLLPDPQNPTARVVWNDQLAPQLWQAVIDDTQLPKDVTSGAITPNGNSVPKTPGKSGSPSSSPTSPPPTATPSNQSVGLCG